MNLIILGDYSGKIEKACDKCKYNFLNLSTLLSNNFTQLEYTKILSLGKEEKDVGKNSHVSLKPGSDALMDGTSLYTKLFNICSFLAAHDNTILFVDKPEKNILFYFKKNLNDNCKIIFNDSLGLLDALPSIYSEFLYSWPTLPYVFTKKSRIKNIISELENAPEKLHPYCYRPKQLGLDISMSSTGVAAKVVDCRGREKIVFGRLKTNRTKIDIHRLPQIKKQINNLQVRDKVGNKFVIDLTYADEVCVEGGAFGAVQGAFRLGQFSGMFLSTLYRDGLKFYYMAPSSLKKVITGYGRAGKGLMELMIKKRLDVEVEINDDEADALCLLTCLIDPDIALKEENLK